MISELDCSIGEGGGSIVRIAVALAAATNTPLKLFNIRSKRPTPGLRPQHVKAIHAIGQVSGMQMVGCEVGNSTLIIKKGFRKKDQANIKISTAGSIGLVAQAVMYYVFPFKREIQLNIKGGATHGKWAPSVEFVDQLTHHVLRKTGKNIQTKIHRYGFYPKGGAQAQILYQKHQTLTPLELTEKGELEEVDIFLVCSSSLKKRDVAQRQYNSFVRNIKVDVPLTPYIQYVDSLSPGTGLTIVSKYSTGARKGFFMPGERGLSSEAIGKRCALIWSNHQEKNGAFDSYTTDQLVLPLALIEGKSRITTDKMTKHTLTNIDLIHKFTQTHIEVKRYDCHHLITIKNN